MRLRYPGMPLRIVSRTHREAEWFNNLRFKDKSKDVPREFPWILLAIVLGLILRSL